MNHQIIDVALAVIRDARGRYLVAQRPASADYADYWEFPGGKREAGENRLQVLQRECSEELGITVQNARPLFRWSYQYSDRHVRLDAWLIYRYNGEAHGAEGQQVRWLHPAEFDDFRFLDANKILMKVLALPEHYAITPEFDGPETFYSGLDSLLAQNIKLLQFRAKGLSEVDYKSRALDLIQWCRNHDVTLMLNAASAWVNTLDAAGLHLTSQRLMALDQRPIAKGRWLSASCHSVEELRHAECIGVDFALLSPVLPTQSHPHAPALGWQALEAWVSEVNIPVYALGGMTKVHLEQAYQVGCRGIAGISAFWRDTKS
ncbi:MAG: hypothetical protein COC05_04140 [Gammaproteobacteria bacterium]|nr:MAG: hypothetical protein COC05_04140 [Gammaproteobacteria bacterium]